MTGSPSTTKGEVVLLPFPFDDLSGSKVRPAVCLTEQIGIHRHIVVAFVTSRIPDEALSTDLALASDAESVNAAIASLPVTLDGLLVRVVLATSEPEVTPEVASVTVGYEALP